MPESNKVWLLAASQSWLHRHLQPNQILNAKEQARAERYVVEAPRTQFAYARAFLRTALGQALQVPPEAVVLGTGPHGKPFVAGEQWKCGLLFNLTHCAGLTVLVASHDMLVGVDAEQPSSVPTIRQPDEEKKPETEAADDDDDRRVNLMSQEGDQFEVEVKVAKMSELVKTMIPEEADEDEEAQEIPLPNVKSHVLAKVIEFCRRYAEEPMSEIEKPLKSANMHEVVQEWYANPRLAISAPRSSERPKLGHDLREIQSTA